MTNVKITTEGDKLILVVDLSETHGKSKSGKTEVVATTHGFVWEAHDSEIIGISLNVNRK